MPLKYTIVYREATVKIRYTYFSFFKANSFNTNSSHLIDENCTLLYFIKITETEMTTN